MPPCQGIFSCTNNSVCCVKRLLFLLMNLDSGVHKRVRGPNGLACLVNTVHTFVYCNGNVSWQLIN